MPKYILHLAFSIDTINKF